MVKYYKFLTIILIIILIAILVIDVKICYNINVNKKEINRQLDIKNSIEQKIDDYYKNTVFKIVENNTTYYKVKGCIDKYFNAWSNMWIDNDIKDIYQYENTITVDGYSISIYWLESLLDLIAENYQKEIKMDVNILISKYPRLPAGEVVLNEIYEYNMKSMISAYLVNGCYISMEDKNNNDFDLLLIIDKNQNTFEIYPKEYIEEKRLSASQEKDSLKWLEEIQKIDKNNYNTYNNPIITNDTIAQDCFSLYMFYLKYDIEKAYSMLDEEYKDKKYVNIEEFKESMEKRITNSLVNCSVNNNKNNYQYICEDNHKFYYIFNMTAPMKFTVVLDTYTMDLPEFITKYNSSDSKTKVALNIQKIVDAINDKNYRYVYEKLDNTFKTNNFNTLDEFEKYAEETFGTSNEVVFGKYIETNNYFTYDIILKNNVKKVEKTIIMKLQEGTDFVISFNVD